jgi:hypothetical protein
VACGGDMWQAAEKAREAPRLSSGLLLLP